MDRRDFLRRGAMGLAALPLADESWLRRHEDEPNDVLLVCELQGGNDGLNTLVPVDDDAYHRSRPTLRVASGALPVGDGFGLHPRLSFLHRAFHAGEAAIQHGVGYPQPDRSHFRSADIWHSAQPEASAPRHGWLGRAADLLQAKGHAVPALALGARELPLALRGRRGTAPAISSLRELTLQSEGHGARRLAAGDRDVRASLDAARGGDALDRLLAEAATAALAGAQKLKDAAEAYRPAAEYPRTGIGRAFELAARLLAAPLGVRMLWLRQGGYDTHAGQERVHPQLLAELDAALSAFARDTQAHRTWSRVTVLVHSEFGRRLAENQSRGTDHGAAAPVFVLGGGTSGALRGKAPSLTELDDGDPVATCDFRSVYAELLHRVLGLDDAEVLGARWPKTRLLRG